VVSIGGASLKGTSAALAPDGRTFAAAFADKSVRIHDAATGRENARLAGHTGAISAVAYTPDGKHIVSGDADRLIIVWDAATGTEIARMTSHRTPVTQIVMSPDGTRVASASDSEALIWETTSGKLISQLYDDAERPNMVANLSFSPDGARILTGGLREGVRVWETKTGRLAIQFPEAKDPFGGEENMAIDHAEFTPNGKHIVSYATNGTVGVFDAATYESLGSIRYEHQMIGFDISHPCLTFDKWRQLLVLDESWRTIDVVQTYF
jgi:WD40 repeat protein